jgi:hypothetical protein
MSIRPDYQAYVGWGKTEPRQEGARYPALIEFVHATALDYLSRGLLTTKRGMYYRAAAQGLVGKSSANDGDAVNAKLAAKDLVTPSHAGAKIVGLEILGALLRGELPWNAFTDEGRRIQCVPGWENARTFLKSVISQFATRLWDSQPTCIVVLIEKDALLKVIEPICNKWRVPFCAGKGHPGDIFLHEDLFGPYVNRAAIYKQSLTFLVLTDCNPSGWMMEHVLRRKLASYVRTHAIEVHPIVERIALTELQIAEHGLEQLGEPLAKNDPNKLGLKKLVEADDDTPVETYDLDEQWDLDALPPDALQLLLDKAIDVRCDQKAWRKAMRFEKHERRKLKGKLT